ncbi:hypothetical protein [Runella sp.]|uniref:hypothetical protein n=1 Tax=Runella sp. TaxID=1960881 RepID=UPI003D151867
MTRREFSQDVLTALTSIAFLDTLFQQQLFAHSVKPIATQWLREMHVLCQDLKTHSITPAVWQQRIDAFYHKLPLEDLMKVIDFEKAISNFNYPDLGVVTKDPVLPKVEGISEKYSFIGRVFGMRKDRAIIPHGHQNMTSCHRVLKGEFLLRQYDRIRDEGDAMLIKQTIEETGKAGSFSSISDVKNNIHWLVATTERAYTFDVIVVGLNEKPTEIDNIDMYNAVKMGKELLKVKKINVDEALKKYGKSHH